MALAAGLIVVLIGCLFNRLALDVRVCPGVKLQAVKCDPLLSYGEFADVGAHRLVEFLPAHAEIAVSITGSNKARHQLLCAHAYLQPAVGRAVLMM